MMKAFTRSAYGGPEVLTLNQIPKPKVKPGHLLVRVVANAANPADWHIMRGTPILARLAFGLFRPKHKTIGADFSGIVEEVGANVVHFKPGDRVFGETLKGGAFSEFTCVPANSCGKMPDECGFLEMAGVPIAGVTALQELITHGKLQPGESVLINGSSGGVGHFAVQIAKALGATVTAVCSSKNVSFVQSLGADHVVAYDQEDIRHHHEKYNLVVDNHGNLTFRDFRRMGDRGVVVGFTTMTGMMALVMKAAFRSYSLAQFTAESTTNDLETLAEMIQTKKVRVHIDKVYPYSQIPDAIGFIEAMHTRGKVVMDWESQES